MMVMVMIIDGMKKKQNYGKGWMIQKRKFAQKEEEKMQRTLADFSSFFKINLKLKWILTNKKIVKKNIAIK